MHQLSVMVNHCAFAGMAQAHYTFAQLPLERDLDGLNREVLLLCIDPLMLRYWLLVSDMGHSGQRTTQISGTSLLSFYQASLGMLCGHAEIQRFNC